MYLFSNDEFENLHSKRDKISVSIFVPMEVAGNYEKNRIGYKTAIKNVEHQLDKMPEADDETKSAIMAKLQELQGNQKFWENQSQGLAVFATKDFFKYYELPVNFEAFEYVADHFYLRPLIPVLSGNGEFLILQLSKENIRLFESTKYSIAEIYTEDLSEDNLMLESEIKDTSSLQHHNQNRQSTYHGHGAPDDQNVQDVKRYFRKVDAKLKEILKNSKEPMLVACVDYLFPIYKSVNSYNHLMDENLKGSFDYATPLELHRKAWELVKDNYEMSIEKEVSKVRSSRVTDEVEESIDKIIFNAMDGNIEKLFIENRATKWGKFNKSTGEISVYEDGKNTGEMELLNTAAIETILRGGKVHLIDGQYLNAMKPKDKAVALLRY